MRLGVGFEVGDGVDGGVGASFCVSDGVTERWICVAVGVPRGRLHPLFERCGQTAQHTVLGPRQGRVCCVYFAVLAGDGPGEPVV